LAHAAQKHWDAGRWPESAAIYREIVRLAPNSAEAHDDLGVVYLRSGRLAEAAASLQRALDLRPGHDLALIHLVEALEAGGRQREALKGYRRLSQRLDSGVERRLYLAKALAIEGNTEQAEDEIRRLLIVAPHHAVARSFLARLLSERGMLDEAAQHLMQAVENRPSAFQQLTAVKRMTEADRPLLERMRLVAERTDLDIGDRIFIRFGLGKAFDDLDEYAEAMRHYIEANRLKATTITRLNRAAMAAWYDSIIARFDAEALARARQALGRPARHGDELPVFIVGMSRSGTTLVEQILSSHPAVAAGGELSFWRDRLRGWNSPKIGAVEAGRLSEAAETYLVELRKIGPQALRVTDKATLNFELLWQLRLVYPEARIIHCRRHPVDTCLSNFFANFGAGQDFTWDRGDLAFFYRQYERLMDHWRRVLPADHFFEVQYETLIGDREAETRRLVAFCGLNWDEACLAPERNTRVVATASLRQVRQPVYRTSIARWRRYEPWLEELRELLPAAETGAS
jgi:tetratricopeptide (TPR) repeat protein